MVRSYDNPDSIGDEEVIRRIKDSYQRALQANIEYYDKMAKAMAETGEKNTQRRYAQMGKVYRALID